MITVEYRIAPATAADFAAAMKDLRAARRRDGAYAWGLFEDVAMPGRYIEYFTEESWLAHLRHHERVAESDRLLQQKVRAFHLGPDDPVVTHYLAPAPGAAVVPPPPRDGELQ